MQILPLMFSQLTMYDAPSLRTKKSNVKLEIFLKRGGSLCKRNSNALVDHPIRTL